MRERYGILTRMELPESVRLNLNSAHKHFRALERKIDRYSERHPYRIVHEHNAEFTEHTLRFVFDKPFPSGPWGHDFGEGIENLADALDNLIYAIAVRENGGSAPPVDADILQFPVWTNFKNAEPPMWRVASLSKDVRAAIRAEQPDPNRPEDSALWYLYKLNSSKKHKTVHLTTTRHETAQILVEGLVPESRCTLTWHRIGLENEAPFLVLASAVPQPDVQMGSAAEGFVGVERIGGHGKPEDFLPIGNLCAGLEAGTRGIIDRVVAAAKL
jgi:hypothetical protein